MSAVRILRPAIVGAGLLLALLLPQGVGAQSAEATTAVPSPGSRTKPRADGLLGNLSLTSDRSPVHISADQLEFDYRKNVLTYRGSVKVKQADLTLNSNVLRVTLDPRSTDQLREVVAEGDVQIAKGDRHASGGRAVFDQASRTIVLSDGAVLRDGPNEVAGERVVVYLDEERSVIEGGKERVRAVLFPEKERETKERGDESVARPEEPAAGAIQKEASAVGSAAPAGDDGE